MPKSSLEKGNDIITIILPFVKYVHRPEPYFSDLAVDPNYRRQGVASALMVDG